MSIAESQSRIRRGHFLADSLFEKASNLPPCKLREEIGAKGIRVERKLDDLVDDFMEEYPDACILGIVAGCRKPNKGMWYVCRECKAYTSMLK